MNNKLQILIDNLEEKIKNQELKSLTKFTFIYADIIIRDLMDQKVQEKFLDFLKVQAQKNSLTFLDIVSFFLDNNITIKIEYRYLKELSVKENISLYNYVKDIRKKIYRIQKSKKEKYFFTPQKKKFKANNKEYTQLILWINNIKKNTFIRLSIDLNVQWKFKHRVSDNNLIHDYSWLIFQIIKGRNYIKNGI